MGSEKQIPFGNDSKKGKGKSRSFASLRMTMLVQRDWVAAS